MREGIASLMRQLASYTPAGAMLEIRWESGEAGLELTLDCAELALSAPVAARLQDPLSVEGLHSRSLEGAGLGVAIADRVMQLHRGRLDLESFEGSGTRVRLTLPQA
jgi:signal transduction histidine kinase